MPESHFIVTINKDELRYVGCCDCSLVHEVSYDIFENKVDMHFERDEARTIRARIERKKDKGKKLGELLDEDMLKNPLNPPSTENINMNNFVTLGHVMTEKVKKNVRPEQNTDSRKKSPY